METGGRPGNFQLPFNILTRVFLVLILALGCLSYVLPVNAQSGQDPEIEELTGKLAKDPNNVDLLILRGQVYRTNGKYLESLQDLDQAWLLDRGNRNVVLQRALTLSALGRDQAAESALTDLLQEGSDPNRIIALAERAHLRARTGQPQLAIADLTSAIQLQPTIELYLTRGQLQESLGNLAAAEAGYQEGLAELGDAVLLKKGLIRVQVDQGQLGKALALINQEAARSPDKIHWHLQRADILAKMGNSTASRQAYERALSETNRTMGKRSTAMQLVARARVLQAMGRVEDAKRDLREAVEQAPRFDEAKDLLRQLEN